MLSNSVEFVLDDGNAHFDWNEIGMNYKFAFRFHFICRADLYTPKGAAVKYSEINRVANRPFRNPLL